MPRWLKGLCSGSALIGGGDKPIKACFGPLLEAQQGADRQGCKGLVGCWIGAELADLEQAQSRAEQSSPPTWPD
jgi:hypothetical protein